MFIPRKKIVTFLKDWSFESDVERIYCNAVHDFYEVAYLLRLVNLSPIALFGEYKLTPSGGKLLERTDYPHVVC